MSAQNPNLRENFNNGVLQNLADSLRTVGFGDLLAALIQKSLGGSKIQSKLIAATGASEALTFQQLDMVPPSSLSYVVLAESETPGVSVDESTKTLLGFTLLGTTNLEVINVTVIEPDGPAKQTLAVSSSAATLSAAPLALLDIIAVEGTTLGRKVLKIAGASVTPAPGEVIWDGATGLRFASADAVTSVLVVALPKASPLVSSALNRILGQQDG